MRFGYSETCLAHDPGPRHPESADRLRAIREGLKRQHGVSYTEGDPASFEALATVHNRDYLERVRSFCADGGGQWDPDTIATPETWDAIRASAGQAIWAIEAAVDGASGRETPFAIGRPPGHHATPSEAMGFCFVNNVAVAAEHGLAGCGLDRVAIVDFDVHHGNGTQDAFIDRDDVFVASIHEDGLYPGSGALEETGTGPGAGTTMNVPLPPGADDGVYCRVLDQCIAPAVERFDPDCLLVSAGFDAHRHDPISRIRLSASGYACLADRLRAMSASVDAPIAFVLEGGYALEELADSVAHVHDTFDGRAPVEPSGDPPDRCLAVIEEVRAVHDLS